MIVALWGMDPRRLHSAPVAGRERGAIRAALRYVRATPELAVPLALMALVGTLGFNFQVVLPLLAELQLRRRRDHLRGARLRRWRSARSPARWSTAPRRAPDRG